VIDVKNTTLIAVAVVVAFMLTVPVFAGGAEAAKAERTQLYYEGDLVTALIPQKGQGGSVTFKALPDNAKAYPFDPIYVFVDEDTDMPHAQNPLIGSVPGDSDYTGGRWQVHLVLGTVAADDDITSVADLMDSGLTIKGTDMYFECPVISK
jgi:hypothetical protein